LTDEVRNVLSGSSPGIGPQLQIYPLPQIKAPVRAPYLFNGQWGPRTDLSAFFNIATLRTSTEPYIKLVNVEVYDEFSILPVANIEVNT
jgi:hypothetical protein